jgi:hypothetical protein
MINDVIPRDPDYLTESRDHREVFRRLVDVSADQLRLVTPAQLIADRSLELGGKVYPGGTRPPHLQNLLDDLVRVELAERVVPTAGDPSYRPTELGRQRMRECEL